MSPRRRFVVCLSLANLLFVQAWALLGSSFEANHLKQPLSYALLGTVADVLLLALILFAAARVLERWPVGRAILRFGLLLCLLWTLRGINATYSFFTIPFGAASIALKAILALACAAGLVWLSRVPKVIHLAAGLALVLSPYFLINLGRLGFDLAAGNGRYADLAPRNDVPFKPGPRVVWIIFDTMDYHYAFEERPSWLKMPELDRLRSESIDCTYALSPGPRTEIAIPSLLTGKLFISEGISKPNDLDLTDAAGKVLSFRSQPNIFGEAAAIGVSSAMVGFHIPYGRILGDQTAYCRWWQWPNRFGSEDSWLESSIRQFSLLVGSRTQTLDSASRRMHNLIEEEKIAQNLAANPSYRLVYLHLFPPHPISVYNAKTGKYDLDIIWDPQQYFHGLGLADRYLGEIRHSMEAAGNWDNTLVIVSADHSWRSAGAFGAKVYPRIPFILHLPKQTSGMAYPDRVNTLCTHDLVLAYLQGSISSPADVSRWLQNWTKSHPNISLEDTPSWFKDNMESSGE